MMILSQRLLYDETFVNDGCPPEDYDPLGEVDDTPATFISNYIIAGIALVGAFIWGYKRRKCYVGSYFLLSGIGYAVAGVGHQVLETTEDNSTPFFIPSLAGVVLGIFCLQLEVVTRHRLATYAVFIIFVLVVATAGVLDFAVDVVSSWLIGGAYLVVSLLLVAIGFVGIHFDYWAGIGTLVYLSGALVQVALAGRCGDDGYENCWRDCPLPNPISFNHNALFHVLVAIGTMIQIFGRYGNGKDDTPVEECSTTPIPGPKQQDDNEEIIRVEVSNEELTANETGEDP